MYTIRRARDGDLAELVRLQNRHAGVTADGPSEQEGRTWGQMMATPNLAVYVALWGDDIVGNTCMTIVPNLINDCRAAAFVEPMLVAASHRRRGVGRRMVERLLEDAQTAGCFKVQLLSHKRHARDGAHAFYRSLGFEPEAEGFRYYVS